MLDMSKADSSPTKVRLFIAAKTLQFSGRRGANGFRELDLPPAALHIFAQLRLKS